jgi:hypothetical protein
MSYAFHVCLDVGHGCELLPTGYINRDRAEGVAKALGETFPANRYFVRRVMIRDDNGRAR